MNEENITECINVLKSGGIVVMPTDTVYGILGLALDADVVSRIFEIKNRTGKLGTILYADEHQLIESGFDSNLVDRASKYWPGPVSVVLPSPLQYPHLSDSNNTTAVRIPEPKWLRGLLLQTGPLATTSANFPGEPTVTNAQQAKELFGAKIEYYLEGSELSVNPSRIIKILANGQIEVIR